MKNSKHKFGVVSSALTGILLAVLVGCNTPALNNQTDLSKQQNPGISNIKETKYTLRGTVQLPKGFTTKANFSDLISGATVVLKDVTGLNALSSGVATSASGGFVVTPSSPPTTGTIYILEVSKIAGQSVSNSPALFLRTYIRWNGTTYDSITGTNIFVNTYTTALTVMAMKGQVTAASTLNSINVVNNVSTPTAITGATVQQIVDVTKLVQQSIYFQRDPAQTITFTTPSNYALSTDPQSATTAQIDRLAIPSLNIVINGYNGFTAQTYTALGMTKAQRDTAKDLYNTQTPSNDVTNYRSFWTTALGAVFPNNSANASANATLLTPDVYTLDMSKQTSFSTLNGRLLADDVVDVELKLLSGVNSATDGVNCNDRGPCIAAGSANYNTSGGFSKTFPYLAGPQ